MTAFILVLLFFLPANVTNQSSYFEIVNQYFIIIVKLRHKQICFGSSDKRLPC